jgi:hypothetical protein
MNARDMLSRLAQVEKNPKVIWDQLHKSYGEDFLLESIEEEYGVTSSSSEKLRKQMDFQL